MKLVTAFTLAFVTFLSMSPFPCFAATAKDDANASSLMDAEKNGQWQTALELSRQVTDANKELKAHVKRLRESLETMNLAEAYRQQQMPERAIRLLEDQLGKLDTLDSDFDMFLIASLVKRIAELEAPRLDAVNVKIELQLEQAIVLKEVEKFDEAIKILENILARPASDLSHEIREKVATEKLQVELDKLKATKPDLTRRIGSGLKEGINKLVEIFFYLIAGIVVFAIFRFIWRLLRPKSNATEIALQDNASSGNDQLALNTALSQELDQTLRRLIEGGVETTDLGGMMDLDASSLPSAPEPHGGFGAFASHIDTTAVAIGPFSLSPRQIFLYMSKLFRPKYASSLLGTLTRDGDDYILRVNRRNTSTKTTEETLFEGRATTRERVLRQVATQLLISLSTSKVTDDWRSLAAYMRAEDKLSQEVIAADARQRAIYLSEAKVELQTALVIDPANWLARYRLASVLRKLGDNVVARQQFDYVGWMLCSDEVLQKRHLLPYVRNSPLFPWLVLHNRAVCGAKEGNIKATMGAIATFGHITQKIRELIQSEDARDACDAVLNSGPTIKPRDIPNDVKMQSETFLEKIYAEGKPELSDIRIYELLMLVRAARTAALVDWLEHEHRKEDNDTEHKDQAKTIFDWIKANEDWFYRHRLELRTMNWSTYAIAHATVQNARGRACYLMRYWYDARNYLEWAVDYHLPARFPEPYINLGALYLKRHSKLSKRWMELAEQYLATALELSPNSKKARYLLGKLYYIRREEGSDLEEKALEQFALAGSDSWSLYRAADILLSRNDIEVALRKLKLSVALADSADWRTQLYVKAILMLASNNEATDQQLKDALRLAKKLEEDGRGKRLKKFGEEVQMEIEKLIAAQKPAI